MWQRDRGRRWPARAGLLHHARGRPAAGALAALHGAVAEHADAPGAAVIGGRGAAHIAPDPATAVLEAEIAAALGAFDVLIVDEARPELDVDTGFDRRGARLLLGLRGGTGREKKRRAGAGEIPIH